MDRRAIDAFQQARPGDINIHSAIGSREAEIEFIMYDDPYHSAMNTILPGFSADLPHTMCTVPMRPLSDLLDQHLTEGKTIDFLNVDAEGCDFDVLNSNDWSRYKPKAIAVEMPGQGVAVAMASASYSLLIREGYELLSHTVVTSIFRRR